MKLQAEKGFSFGAPTELETEIAKFIIENVPNIIKSEWFLLVRSLYKAHSFSKRLWEEKIIKFEGCYHGHSDSF